MARLTILVCCVARLLKLELGRPLPTTSPRGEEPPASLHTDVRAKEERGRRRDRSVPEKKKYLCINNIATFD